MSDCNVSPAAPADVLEAHSAETFPLCVDLDGTLIRTDMLWESVVVLLRRNPLYAASLVVWTFQGKANLKRRISSRVTIDPAGLPYHAEFLAYLRTEREKGRRLILVTAADRRLAEPVARHAGVFSEVMASDGVLNLKGVNKRAALNQRFGIQRYDYAGNSHADIAVWEGCHKAIVVNAGDSLRRKAAKVSSVALTFPSGNRSALALAGSVIRMDQWLDNLLVFLPLACAGRPDDLSSLGKTALAYAAFCMCSSSASVLGSLAAMESDRRNASRKSRPFASGALSIPFGAALAGCLAAGAAGTGLLVSRTVVGLLSVYYLMRLAHAIFARNTIRGLAIRAGAYAVCVWAGIVTTRIALSPRMAAFSAAACLGLAIVRQRRESR